MAGSVGRKFLGVAQLAAAVCVAGVLVAAVMLPFTGGLGLAARNSVQAFDEQPCDVDPGTPKQASTMFASDGTQIATFYTENRAIIPAAQIPQVMRRAIIAIEDRRFLEHHGVDTEALLRAMVKNSQSGEVVQGGSTLTMQYVKNVRLYSAKTDAERTEATARNSGRKLIEARCALELENRLSKDQILTNYLNITYFGAGAYGVQTAAKIYFNKNAPQLTLPEAALLAGLVQSPSGWDPYRSIKKATERRNTVLNDMQSLGYITAKQASQAKASKIKLRPKAKSSGKDCANTSTKIVNAGFFCDYAKAALKVAGLTQERLESGGYKVYTTLSPAVQNRVQSAMPFSRWANRKSIAVTDMIDPKTGNVLAFGVSRKYGVNKKDRNVTSNPLNTNATAGAGSTYKTYTLVSALQNKVPLRDFQINVGNEYTSNVCVTYGNNGKEQYTVGNAGTYREGSWNLADATVASVNTFFVALLDQRFNCDVSGPVKAAQAMGLVNTLNAKAAGGRTVAQDYIDGKKASFTLGPNGTSPLEMTSSYATLANGGKYCPPTPILKVVGPDGKQVALPERQCEQRIDKGIADTVTQVLEKDTSTSLGTAASAFGGLAGSQRPIAGKTGTASGLTQDDLARKDGKTTGNSAAWFVGYTPDFAGATAVFNPDNPRLALEDVPDKPRNVFGAYSAKIWREAMEPILRDRTWQFAPEDPEVVNGDSVPVPSVVGLDEASARGVLIANGFQVRVSDERKNSAVPTDFVAEQSPSGRGSRGMMIVLYLSNGQPPAGTPGQPGQPGQVLPPPRRRGIPIIPRPPGR